MDPDVIKKIRVHTDLSNIIFSQQMFSLRLGPLDLFLSCFLGEDKDFESFTDFYYHWQQ